MFCEHCGVKIPDDSKFCPACGAKQEPVAVNLQKESPNQGTHTPVESMSPEQEEKIKKRNKIIGISFAAAIGLCVMIGVLSAVIKPSVNLNKYMEISFEGYDTVGKAIVEFDYDAFRDDYKKKIPGVENFLYSCVNGKLDKASGLCNEDTVTYSWTCDDEKALESYGYKLKYKDITATVSGLKEAKIFDPFDGIQVLFSGIAPNGNASVEGSNVADAARDFSFELDDYGNLSNGDIVTLRATMYANDPVEYCIENYGMVPSPLTKEYTVEGLDAYIQSSADVSKTALEDMKKQAEDVYSAYVAREWEEDASLQSLSYIGNYVLTTKNHEDYWGPNNQMYLVYKAQIKNTFSNDEETYDKVNEVYWYICYENLVVSADKTTTVNITEYITPSDRMTVDSGIDYGWWGTKTWDFSGYKSLAELYKNAVTKKAEFYNCENNVEESMPEIVETEKTEENLEDKEFIFPNSSDEKIEISEMEKLSDEELRYAINELYAKHGYIFKDEALKAHYEQFDWYEPSVKPEDFSVDMFNEIERENIDTMKEVRDSRA